MEIKYVPTACRGKKAIFEGSVTIKAPSFDERYGYIDESGFKFNEDGEMSGGMDQIKAIRNLVKSSESHYTKIQIKHKETGKEFKTFKAMCYDNRCDPILTEVAMNLLNGFTLGND